MRTIKEDNNGFVNFPLNDNIRKTNGKTLVYIIAFDDEDYILSNLTLNLIGEYVTDDVTGRCVKVLNDDEIENDYTNLFENKAKSFPFITSVCLGWNNITFKDDNRFWFATFRDLTNEGRKLYYSIKKLHNNKEVRILTFNNVK